jgi:hypothetical protein
VLSLVLFGTSLETLNKNKSHFWTDLLLWKKIIQNKQNSAISGCVYVVEIVEMDDEELSVLDDVLEEANAARSQCCLKNQNYVVRKNWKNLRVSENQ